MSNSIIQAIAQILGVIPEGNSDRPGYFTTLDNHRVWIGFYRRDLGVLRHLWSLDADGYPRKDQNMPHFLEKCIRIILIETWDGQYLGADKLAARLTALDWAHCFCAVFGKRIDSPNPPQIDVLDLRGRANVNDEFQTDRSSLARFVRYFAPGRVGRIGELDAFLKSLRASIPAPQGGEFATALQTSNRKWLMSLALANTREGSHFLNNTLGPLVLAASADDDVRAAVVGCATATERLAQAAMLRAMQWVMEPSTADGNTGARTRVDWQAIYREARYKPNRELRILLLDDQAIEGWVPVLSDALDLACTPESKSGQSIGGFTKRAARVAADGAPAVSLWVATEANRVLDSVKNRKPSPKGIPEALRFTDTGSRAYPQIDELLLLDLRLFSSTANGPRSTELGTESPERRFFEKVREALVASGETDLSEIPDSKEGNSTYLVALTWFARLIANVDYTYPIILWSSTGQRKVVDSLKDLPSVYTRLEKPRFESYGIERIDVGLSDAIAHQIHMLAAVSFVQAKRKAPLITRPCARADIYTDETGGDDRRPLELGGFAVVYQADDQTQLEQTVNSFRNSLDAANCTLTIQRDGAPIAVPFLWGPTRLSTGPLHINPAWIRKDDVGSGPSAKSNAIAIYTMLGQAAGRCAPGEVCLVFFNVCPKDQISTPFNLASLDGRYYSAMPYLLEALVAHVIAPDPSVSNVTFRLRTPSRVVPLKMDKDAFLMDWGSEVFSIDSKYHSVTDQWIHATAWTLAERNHLPDKCIHGASAPSINRLVVNSDIAPLQSVEDKLRFCADPIPRFPPHNLNNVFIDNIDDAFRAIVDAAAKRFEDLGAALADTESGYAIRSPVATKGTQWPLLGDVIASLSRFAKREMLANDFHRYVVLRRHCSSRR